MFTAINGCLRTSIKSQCYAKKHIQINELKAYVDF